MSRSLECPGLHVWSPSLQGPLPSLPSWALHCAGRSGPHQGPFTPLDFQSGGPMGSAGRGQGREVGDGCLGSLLAEGHTPSWWPLSTQPLSSPPVLPPLGLKAQTLPVVSSILPAPLQTGTGFTPLGGPLSLYHLFPRPALIGPLSCPLPPTLFLSPPGPSREGPAAVSSRGFVMPIWEKGGERGDPEDLCGMEETGNRGKRIGEILKITHEQRPLGGLRNTSQEVQLLRASCLERVGAARNPSDLSEWLSL